MPFWQGLRKVGNLVDLEAFVGLIDPPFLGLQQGVQVHRPCVIVNVICALPVGKQLDALDQARWVPHDGVEVVGRIIVHEAEGNLDRVGVQPVAPCRQRNARDPAGRGGESAEAAWEELDILSRYDVGRVARPHLIIKRADELIVDSVGHLIHRSCLAFPSTAPR